MNKAKLIIPLTLGMLSGGVAIYHMKSLMEAGEISWVWMSYPAKLVFAIVALLSYFWIDRKLSKDTEDTLSLKAFLSKEPVLLGILLGLFLINLWLFELNLWIPVKEIVFK